MSIRPYLYVSATIFALVSVMHLVRVVWGGPVLIGSCSVPAWPSWAGFFVAAGLSIWGFRLAGGPRGSSPA